jgi:hypothetical protein
MTLFLQYLLPSLLVVVLFGSLIWADAIRFGDGK